MVVAMLLTSCASPQPASPATSPQPSTMSGAAGTPTATPLPAHARVIAKPGPMLVTTPGAPHAGQSAARPLDESPRCEEVCGPSIVTLRWQPAAGASRQRIQMARAPSEFVPEVVLESQDLAPTTSEVEWRILYAGTINYWRIVSEIGGGWIVGPHKEFQAAGCQQCDER